MGTWENLLVWQKAHKLVLEVFKLTSSFPESEKWGLTNQLRRSIVSVPANIVEGKSRNTDKEMLHFLHIARGSLEESRYYILLASDLSYISSEERKIFLDYCSEVSFLLNKLIKAVRK